MRYFLHEIAVPAILCANPSSFFVFSQQKNLQWGAIELDGGTFKTGTGHNSGVGLRQWREKNNAAMSLGWRVWHYAPEEVIKAGRKTLPNEPVITRLPWMQEKKD